jgi:tetratricopeptide (TPR) repeat protein
MGDLADRLERPQEALAHYQAALEIYRRLGDRYSLARALLLSLAPFHLRHDQVLEAFRAYVEGLRALLPLDAAFFRGFLNGAFEQVRDLVRMQPAQAAAGCALLLQELQADWEEARAQADERSASLLNLALSLFQVVGLVAVARTTFQRARALAEQVDQATDARFGLVAWVDEMSDMP